MNDAPLLTSQIRQDQEKERTKQLLERYPTTMIRVQFPDGVIVQMPLPSDSDLSLVKRQVSTYLTQPDDDFYLFTSPPKEILKTDVSLLQLGNNSENAKQY